MNLVLSACLAVTIWAGEPQSLFNGKDFTGWELVSSKTARQTVDPQHSGWSVEEGVIVSQGKAVAWLSTAKEYSNFELSLEYRLGTDGANSGIYIRAPRAQGNPSYSGMEIQIIHEECTMYSDPKHPHYYALQQWQETGAVYGVHPPRKRNNKPQGEWNKMVIRAEGRQVKVTLNGEVVVDCNLDEHADKAKEHSGILRSTGYIGLSSHHDCRLEFRDITVQEL